MIFIPRYINYLIEKRSVFQFQSAVPSLNTYEKIIGYRLLKVLDLKKKTTYISGLKQGIAPSGDMIPWNVARQFQDDNFPSLSGARIVRIATHPSYQSMGYGSKAIELLQNYYEMKVPNIDSVGSGEQSIEAIVDDEEVSLLEETIKPRKNLPPLLLQLSERKPEKLDYLGVSYGLTRPLLKFWTRGGN